MITRSIVLLACCCILGCTTSGGAGSSRGGNGNRFDDDVAFLKKHTPVVVLSDASGKSRVAVAPALQGRVMTSTAGDGGASFGWINRKYFDEVGAGKTNPHISPYGGEDRFWIGPEGGQFSIFFEKGEPFDFEHWNTPKFIDVEPFETVSSSSNSAEFRRRVTFSNYSGTPFDIEIGRTVRLLSADDAWKHLNVAPVGGVNVVAFETDNTIANAGKNDWSKQTGLLSIWILSMFNASPDAVVVIPIQPGSERERGMPVNDDYFGKVPPERLKVVNDVVYFKADGNFRSKIGISPARTKPVMASYDPAQKMLTIAQFTFDPNAKEYVNSAWKVQDDPYAGDVANSYNDGPPGPGKPQLGKFYELESSSPAKELKAGESMNHVHRTIHLQGDEDALDKVARAVLGVSLEQIRTALPK